MLFSTITAGARYAALSSGSAPGGTTIHAPAGADPPTHQRWLLLGGRTGTVNASFSGQASPPARRAAAARAPDCSGRATTIDPVGAITSAPAGCEAGAAMPSRTSRRGGPAFSTVAANSRPLEPER